ncbi:MAG: hypothetical protein JWL79_3084 [Frankiales bacterium]|nr:hypothetical protein [Frankiales bacterium]
MTTPLPDTWSVRDYPVLVEVTRLFDQGRNTTDDTEIAGILGWDPEQVRRAFTALQRRGLIDGEGDAAVAGLNWVNQLSGQAYLLTGLHPDGDDTFSRLISALTQAAELTADPEEKGRIRRAVDGLLGISRDIGVSVTTAVITGQVT